MNIRKTTIAVFLFLFVNSYVLSQSSRIDSLKTASVKANEDSNKVNILNELSYNFHLVEDSVNAIQYADKAMILAEKINYKKGLAVACTHLGNYFLSRYNFPSSLEKYMKALTIQREIGDTEGLMQNYINVARVKGTTSFLPEALNMYYNAVSLAEKEGNQYFLSRAYSGISETFNVQGNYEEALRFAFKALKLYEKLDDKKSIAYELADIGFNYIKTGDLSEAIKKNLAALEIYKQMGNKRGEADCVWNIGEVYFLQGNYTAAMEKYQYALPFYEEAEHHFYISWIYNDMGNVLEKQADSANKAGNKKVAAIKLAEAIKFQHKAMAINKKYGNKQREAITHIQLGNIYTGLRENLKAKQYFEKAIEIAASIGSKDLLRDSYEGLSKSDSAEGNYSSAFRYYKMFLLYRDSVLNNLALQKTESYRMQYDFDKKEDSLRQQQLLTENKLAVQKKQRNFYWIGLAMLSTLPFFIYLSLRNQKKINQMMVATHAKQKTELEMQNEQALLNERLRISSDLHDEVGATLSGITMYSHLIKGQLKSYNLNDAESSLQVMQQSSSQMVDKLNDIVWFINPEKDSLPQLISRLEDYTIKMAAIKGIKVNIKVPHEISNSFMNAETRRNIYLFCKEAINNAVKYSNATTLDFFVAETSGLLQITVADNGAGFDVLQSSNGNGLANMKNRAAAINGQMQLESGKAAGTTIKLSIKITQ